MSLDLIHLWHSMGWFAKGVVFVMAFMSIWSLTITITKFVRFQRTSGRPGSSRRVVARASRRRTWTRRSPWPRRTRRATSPGCWARRWPR